MSKVILGGSRSVSRLNAPVRERVENIVSQGFDIVIGDANGADKALQEYLATRGYEKVTVFCSGDVCRNNLGNWKTVFIPTGRQKLDFEHYAQKDARMVGEADYGLFLWNGKSHGTLNSVRMLLKRGRPALVYISPKKSFVTMKMERDLEGVLGEFDLAVPHPHRRNPKNSAKSGVQRSLFG
ncbi:MAG: hypothetical protein HYU29_08240 [Chloroflexi bacterium]|nr:hypothetical protein [Chloroflexota bacterium]